MAADLTVMSHVNVGHQQGVAADLGHALAAGLGATVDRHALEDGHVVADLHVGYLSLVLKILRDGSHDSPGKDLTVLPHPDVGIYHRVRMDLAAVADLDIIVDEGERADLNVVAKFSLRAD